MPCELFSWNLKVASLCNPEVISSHLCDFLFFNNGLFTETATVYKIEAADWTEKKQKNDVIYSKVTKSIYNMIHWNKYFYYVLKDLFLFFNWNNYGDGDGGGDGDGDGDDIILIIISLPFLSKSFAMAMFKLHVLLLFLWCNFTSCWVFIGAW